MRKEIIQERCKSANSWAVFVERHAVFSDSSPVLRMKYDHLYMFKREDHARNFSSNYSANNKFIVTNTGELEKAA